MPCSPVPTLAAFGGGTPPLTGVNDYLCKLRVGHACLLLVETDLPISVIAARVGFFNLSNFNRSFRKIRQIAPMKLRHFVQQHGRLPKLSTETEVDWLSANVPAQTLVDTAIRPRHSFVLAQVLVPGAHDECFQVTARSLQIAANPPV